MKFNCIVTGYLPFSKTLEIDVNGESLLIENAECFDKDHMNAAIKSGKTVTVTLTEGGMFDVQCIKVEALK